MDPTTFRTVLVNLREGRLQMTPHFAPSIVSRATVFQFVGAAFSILAWTSLLLFWPAHSDLLPLGSGSMDGDGNDLRSKSYDRWAALSRKD
jgi:hypothetical protein